MKVGDKVIFGDVVYEAFPDNESYCILCELKNKICLNGNLSNMTDCTTSEVHFVRPDEAVKRRLRGEPV